MYSPFGVCWGRKSNLMFLLYSEDIWVWDQNMNIWSILDIYLKYNWAEFQLLFPDIDI